MNNINNKKIIYISSIIIKLLLLFNFILNINGLEPCTGEVPDICGFLPSTYSNLSLTGVPVLCLANCTLEGGFDLCGICGGIAPISNATLLTPPAMPGATRIGGSVASWNGTVAASQHIAQEYAPTTTSPIVTWNLNHNTGSYTKYILPYSTDGTSTGAVPLSRGYGLIMSENYLVVGDHDSTPRVVQLWVRTTTPPWSWLWTANDPCPGHYFGFSVGIDENINRGNHPGVYGTVVVGDPAAHASGRVYVYLTYSSSLLDTLYYGFGNETEQMCFGESVSADSSLLAVGAPSLTYSSQSKAGSVFIYRWNPASGLQGMYELVVQIPPPVPTANGGFGESVSVWSNFVMIGDNQRQVYLYEISGFIAIPSLLDQPDGINLASRLGYAVSIWDNYAIAGDEDFIPSPTSRGATFVWDRNPLFPLEYRPMYELHDDSLSLSTRYGADVDNRGGCYIVSGAPHVLPYGAVFVVDLCRNDCYGCDNVLNSCLVDDFCGVCNGDNSTCLDCFGVLNGPATYDACMVCDGTNSTCVIPTPVSELIVCEGQFNITLTHEFEAQWGLATWTLVAPFATKGVATIVGNRYLSYIANPFETGVDTININVTLPTTHASTIFAATVTIGSCLDCFGVLNGLDRPDLCGICGGDNTTCMGCDGIPNSGIVYDYCEVCGGDNSTCLNITAVPTESITCTAQIIFIMEHEPAATPVTWSIVVPPLVGSAYINPITGIVIWNNPGILGVDWFVVQATSSINTSVTDTTNVTFLIQDCSDCNGVQGGTQLIDLCGVCGGDSTSCMDCLGIPNGMAVLDVCNICNGPGTSCLDCFGVPFGPAVVDVCGVCGGDGSSCSVNANPLFLILFVITITIVGLWIIYVVVFSWFLDTRHIRTPQHLNQYERVNIKNPPPVTKSIPVPQNTLPNLDDDSGGISSAGMIPNNNPHLRSATAFSGSSSFNLPTINSSLNSSSSLSLNSTLHHRINTINNNQNNNNNSNIKYNP